MSSMVNIVCLQQLMDGAAEDLSSGGRRHDCNDAFEAEEQGATLSSRATLGNHGPLSQ